MNIHNTKINNFGSERLSGGLNSSKIVLKFLSSESIVLAKKGNAVDVKRLVTALYPISVARAQSTFLTASEKVRQIIGCRCLVLISYEEGDFSGQYCLPL